MDLPLDVIREPGHFFVRVEYGNSNYLEWDPMKGRKIPNFFPEKLAEIRYKKIKDQFREAVKNGVYYKALTRKEISAVHDDIIGSMWFNKGHIDKAIKLFEKAVYLYPAFAEAFYHLGNAQNKKAALLAQNGNLEDAFIVFNQALQNHVKSIELSPTFPEPYRGIGNTLVRKAHIFMKFNDYDKTFTNLNMAIKSYNKALEEYPNFPRVRDDLDNVMAKTYNNMGIAFVGKAHVLMNYGDFKGALKNFNKAIGFYDESLSLNPECSEAHGAKELALKRKKTLMYKMNKKLSRAQLSKHPN
ncbi:hypothetical protein KY339_01340 [Candidatus Woesearchaeota archaeon]|nr:hypothetical protein [Candidatus Woesearchaeota archaeon]